MPEFKKNPGGMKPSGFKMKGYSYPGTSPLKGAKARARKADAAEKGDEAMAKIKEFGEGKVESTDLLSGGEFTVDAPIPASPITKKASPARNNDDKDRKDQKLEKVESIKAKELPVETPSDPSPATEPIPDTKQASKEPSKMSKFLGSEAGGAAVNAGIQLAAAALTPTPKQTVRRGGEFSGFSKLKFGRS